MSFKKVVAVLGGSFFTLIPGIPFYKGIIIKNATSFSGEVINELINLMDFREEPSSLKGILQLCNSSSGGGR